MRQTTGVKEKQTVAQARSRGDLEHVFDIMSWNALISLTLLIISMTSTVTTHQIDL